MTIPQVSVIMGAVSYTHLDVYKRQGQKKRLADYSWSASLFLFFVLLNLTA